MPYKIIFMGTPAFAVPALKALVNNAHEVMLVVSQPDRKKGRGRKLVAPPIKAVADALGLEVVQPNAIKTPEYRSKLAELKPEFFIVVAYGRILTRDLLQIPKFGSLNIHASLLPKYRGPAPIQWAIINGESETGVTTMLHDEGLDTGDVIMAAKTDIFPDDTSQTLHDRLSLMGAEILIDTLNEFESGRVEPVPQDDNQATYAPLLQKGDGRINWQNPAPEIDCFIRGMNPWPGAFTFQGSTRFKIFKAGSVDREANAIPGSILDGFPDELWIATGNGILSIEEIQTDSGKRLPIIDFLRGSRLMKNIPFV